GPPTHAALLPIVGRSELGPAGLADLGFGLRRRRFFGHKINRLTAATAADDRSLGSLGSLGFFLGGVTAQAFVGLCRSPLRRHHSPYRDQASANVSLFSTRKSIARLPVASRFDSAPQFSALYSGRV